MVTKIISKQHVQLANSKQVGYCLFLLVNSGLKQNPKYFAQIQKKIQQCHKKNSNKM
jgi:hypothetical protein